LAGIAISTSKQTIDDFNSLFFKLTLFLALQSQAYN
jgi:hypothetical protein